MVSFPIDHGRLQEKAIAVNVDTHLSSRFLSSLAAILGRGSVLGLLRAVLEGKILAVRADDRGLEDGGKFKTNGMD